MERKLPRRDICAGLFVILVGAFAAWEASNYEFGSLRSIGSGFFPVMLGLLALPIGIAILWEAATRPADQFSEFEESESIGIRPVLAIVAGLVAFALLIENAGLVPAIFATVILASFAERTFRPLGVVLLAAFIAAMCVAIFVFGLTMPIRIFAW
jgi:hypothetical protein